MIFNILSDLGEAMPNHKNPTFAQQMHAQSRRGRKGAHGRRIIRSVTRNGRRYELHATKGCRSYRAS